MQKHWDVIRSDNAGDYWQEVSGNLPTDFGFPIDVHAHEPETIYVVPIKSDSRHFPPEGKLRVFRSRTGGNEWEPLTKACRKRLLRECPPRCDVRRHARLLRRLFRHHRRPGVLLARRRRFLAPIVRDLPAVVSVEVQTLPSQTGRIKSNTRELGVSLKAARSALTPRPFASSSHS